MPLEANTFSHIFKPFNKNYPLRTLFRKVIPQSNYFFENGQEKNSLCCVLSTRRTCKKMADGEGSLQCTPMHSIDCTSKKQSLPTNRTDPPKGHVYLALTLEIPLNFTHVLVVDVVVVVILVVIVLVCCSFSAQFAPQSILLPRHAYTLTLHMQFASSSFPKKKDENITRMPPS